MVGGASWPPCITCVTGGAPLQVQGFYLWWEEVLHRRVLPYLGMVGRFRGDDPFLRFSIQLGPYCMPQHYLIVPLFLQKKLVCLYHI